MSRRLTKSQERLVRDNRDAARLVAKVNFSATGCWEWTGTTNGKSYGALYFRGKVWRAHRVSYTLFCGEVPEGLLVCHHCDNPCCVNPAHLFLGHASTNMKDMVRKGRNPNIIRSDQSHFKSGSAPSGEHASGAKLSEDIARTVIDLGAMGALTKDIAERFQIDRTAVQRILRGETWKHLARPSSLPRKQGAYDRRAALQQEGE